VREWCSLAALLSLGHLLLCSFVSALRYLVTQTLTHSLAHSLTHSLTRMYPEMPSDEVWLSPVKWTATPKVALI
jgi:hypothetical protein